MKKILAFVCVFALVLSLSAAAFADDASSDGVEWIELTYDMIDPSVFDGGWFTVCQAFDMWLPVGWIDVPLSEEDIAGGLGMVYCEETGEHVVTVGYMTPEEVGDDISALMLELVNAGIELSFYQLNGIPAFAYADESTDSYIVSIQDVDGGLYLIIFSPASDDSYIPAIVAMMASISPIGD